jgi:hypothetical protein
MKMVIVETRENMFIIGMIANIKENERRMKKMSKGKGVSRNTHTKQQVNHYANQHNPNNSANKANNNNHANQCNPNNSNYKGNK